MTCHCRSTRQIYCTGIQNKGVEHVLPEKIRTEEYQYVQFFMKSSEQKDFQKRTKKLMGNKKDLKKDALEKLDDQLAVAFIANAQLSSVEKSSFSEQLEQQQKASKRFVTGRAGQRNVCQHGFLIRVMTKN